MRSTGTVPRMTNRARVVCRTNATARTTMTRSVLTHSLPASCAAPGVNTTRTSSSVRKSTAGFTTSAGSNQLFAIQAEVQRMGAKGWLRLKAVEVVNDPVLGGILIEMIGPRYASQVP